MFSYICINDFFFLSLKDLASAELGNPGHSLQPTMGLTRTVFLFSLQKAGNVGEPSRHSLYGKGEQ